MKLHGYQIRASQELTNRYIDYQNNSNKPKNKRGETIPIILTLASITGSGKTAILAKTINNIFDHYVKVKPIIFWLGYSKIIVEQTLNKLSDGDTEKGYKQLILTAEVKSFANINSIDIEEVNIPLIYVDTVQKFNARSEKDRRIYQIEEDKENHSK
jgi:type III restriction enzyme